DAICALATDAAPMPNAIISRTNQPLIDSSSLVATSLARSPKRTASAKCQSVTKFHETEQAYERYLSVLQRSGSNFVGKLSARATSGRAPGPARRVPEALRA